MVDVGAKPLSRRRAVARGRVGMAAATAEQLRTLPKGDALTVARIAAIQAAKRTSDLIPLCHPLPLTLVEVELTVDGDGVAIEAVAETTAQTGVEMEALTAVAVAALTVYDMAKAVDRELRIDDISLVSKTKEPCELRRRAAAAAARAARPDQAHRLRAAVRVRRRLLAVGGWPGTEAMVWVTVAMVGARTSRWRSTASSTRSSTLETPGPPHASSPPAR